MVNQTNALLDFFLAAWDGAAPAADGLRIDQLSVEGAYDVQRRVIEARCQRGERPVGYKVGCTSTGIRSQFGIHEPICGRLMEPHLLHGDVELDAMAFRGCAIEPEFVLQMSRDVTQEVTDPQSLIESIEFVAPGIEVHHYQFHFEPRCVQELICSNGIHALQVVGKQRLSPDAFNWDLEGIGVFKNDAIEVSGIGAEIQGGPLRSLAWLANHLLSRGEKLLAGDWVIPGSAVPLVDVAPGDVIEARFTNLGTSRASFTASS